MGIKTTFKDGQGTGVEASVSVDDKRGKHVIHTTIESVAPGLIIPTGTGITGRRLIGDDSRLSLNGDGVTFNAAVNGSVTPQEFLLNAVETGDILVSSIKIFGADAGIKLKNFFGINGPLTNGCVIDFRSDNIVNTYRTIQSTSDLEKLSGPNHFALRVEAGGDSAMCEIIVSPPLPLRQVGTFGAVDDFMRITINDNITTVTSFEIQLVGVVVDAGEF